MSSPTVSKKHDAMRQVRVTEDNWNWMEQYRKLIAFPASFATIANMLMEKGRDRMPVPETKPAKGTK